MHRAAEDQPFVDAGASALESFAFCAPQNMAAREWCDIPAAAAHLTVSDDLAAAAEKGKAAASRFPDAKIALQGRMPAWRSHTLTPHTPETGSLILAYKKLECWLEKMRLYNASKALQGKMILSTRYHIIPTDAMLQGCRKKRFP